MSRLLLAASALLLTGCFDSVSATDGGASARDAGVGEETCAPGELAVAQDHCSERQEASCRRELFASRITEPELAECRDLIDAVCAGAAWPAGCSPSCEEAAACIELLTRADMLSLPTDQLLAMNDECSLCP